MATLASVGFASLHISDTAAARAAVVTTATAMTDQRTSAIEAAKAAVDAASKARLAECLRTEVRRPGAHRGDAHERTTERHCRSGAKWAALAAWPRSL
jgi:enoyl-CoA hydratase/carnithine racemase